MEAISNARRYEFERRMMRRLVERFSMRFANWTEPEMLRFVRTGMEKAARYNVRFEGDLARFLDCMAWLGADFDTHASTEWASHILRRGDIYGSEKMNRIDRYIAFELRVKP